MGQHRITKSHSGKVVSIEEGKLRQRLQKIAAEHIRWGRGMAYRLLRREGWGVNNKQVQRLWRKEGLQRSVSRKRKRARQPTALCSVSGLSIPTRCRPWISSSMPRLTVGDSNS